MAVCTNSEASTAINTGKHEYIDYSHDYCSVLTNGLNYPKQLESFCLCLGFEEISNCCFSLANDLQNRTDNEVCFGFYSEFADCCRETVKHYFSIVLCRSSPPNLVIME